MKKEAMHASLVKKEAMHARTHVSDISENPTDSGRARIVIEYYLPTPTASEAAMQACQGILTADFDFCGHALDSSTGSKAPL